MNGQDHFVHFPCHWEEVASFWLIDRARGDQRFELSFACPPEMYPNWEVNENYRIRCFEPFFDGFPRPPAIDEPALVSNDSPNFAGDRFLRNGSPIGFPLDFVDSVDREVISIGDYFAYRGFPARRISYDGCFVHIFWRDLVRLFRRGNLGNELRGR